MVHSAAPCDEIQEETSAHLCGWNGVGGTLDTVYSTTYFMPIVTLTKQFNNVMIVS